jgi:hypothetical protein
MAFDPKLVRRFLSLICALVTVTIIPAAVAQSSAHTEVSSNTSRGPALTKLFPPVYPSLALAAHIWGNVDLMLNVRQDGSVESARIISGHPLLRQAALDSAQQSQFECRDCKEAVTPYQLAYTFQLGETSYCTTKNVVPNNQAGEFHPKVSQSQNQVTIVDNPVGTCDMPAEIRGVRSAKCMYLWRCSSR